jgi:hypothetical protein
MPSFFMHTGKVILLVIIAGSLSVLLFLFLFWKQAKTGKEYSDKRMEEFNKAEAELEKLRDTTGDGLPGLIDTIAYPAP